jgi:group II intron reverse transcriptase/maturase
LLDGTRGGSLTTSLLDRVASVHALYAAWFHVRRVNEPTSKGIDGISVADFGKHLKNHLEAIGRELSSGRYTFQKLVPVPIEKRPGEYRPLSVPAVRDRVVMRAAYELAAPRVPRIINPCSYGYVPKRKRDHAVAHVLQSVREGRAHVLEADIRRFFDEVDRAKLVTALSAHFGHDRRFQRFLEASVHVALADTSHLTEAKRSVFPEDDTGIPQGGGLSPFFANVFLLPLDLSMSARGFDMVRWADDFIVLCEGGAEALRALDLARDVLEGQLGLRLHPLGAGPEAKTKITSLRRGFEFLGLRFDADGVRPGRKKRDSFLRRISEVAAESRTVRELLHAVHSRTTAWVKAYRFCVGPRADALWEQVDAYVLEHTLKGLRRLSIEVADRSVTDLHAVLGLPRAAALMGKRTRS